MAALFLTLHSFQLTNCSTDRVENEKSNDRTHLLGCEDKELIDESKNEFLEQFKEWQVHWPHTGWTSL
jgi:hypothetical protein